MNNAEKKAPDDKQPTTSIIIPLNNQQSKGDQGGKDEGKNEEKTEGITEDKKFNDKVECTL